MRRQVTRAVTENFIVNVNVDFKSWSCKNFLPRNVTGSVRLYVLPVCLLHLIIDCVRGADAFWVGLELKFKLVVCVMPESPTLKKAAPLTCSGSQFITVTLVISVLLLPINLWFQFWFLFLQDLKGNQLVCVCFVLYADYITFFETTSSPTSQKNQKIFTEHFSEQLSLTPVHVSCIVGLLSSWSPLLYLNVCLMHVERKMKTFSRNSFFSFYISFRYI